MKSKKNAKAKKPSKKAVALKQAQKKQSKISKKVLAINKKSKKTGKPVPITIININKTKSKFLVNEIHQDLPKRSGRTIRFTPVTKKGKKLKEVTKKVSYIKKLKYKK